MASKPATQKAGQHELALGRIGAAKADIADPRLAKLDAFMQKNVDRDTGKILASRANYDTEAAFRGGLGAREAAMSGNTANLGALTKLKRLGASAGYQDAIARGVDTKDSLVSGMANISIGQQGDSGSALASAAKMESQRLAQAAELAKQKRDTTLQALGSVAGGFQSKMAGDALAEKNKIMDKDFAAFREARDPSLPYMSKSDWYDSLGSGGQSKYGLSNMQKFGFSI